MYGVPGTLRITRENDDIIYYGYDNADRLTSEQWIATGGASIYAFEWQYDGVGNRTYESYNSEQTYYEYDAANELIQSQQLDTGWSYYQYDARGNCLTMMIWGRHAELLSVSGRIFLFVKKSVDAADEIW